MLSGGMFPDSLKVGGLRKIAWKLTPVVWGRKSEGAPDFPPGDGGHEEMAGAFGSFLSSSSASCSGFMTRRPTKGTDASRSMS
jgi:hypothetical protein